MPTSPSKRPSAGGRLGRLLASLRAPARAAGPFPVQTGFPTSLADLVVKNRGRLRNPRRRRAVPPSPVPPPAAPPAQERTSDALTGQNPKGAAFSIRPEVLAVGGAVSLALLVVWSKWLVAAATFASVALFWIESVRSSASRCPPRPEATDLVSRGRGLVSPIRELEGESVAGTPRSSCADSDRETEASSLSLSLWAVDRTDLAARADDEPIVPNRAKEKRRSLRKLIAKKLRHGKRSKTNDTDTCSASARGAESKNSDAGSVTAEAPLPAPAADTPPPHANAVTDEQRGAFPSAALVPIALVGLVAGKLPAVALTVLCAVFSSSVDRVVPSS